VSFTTLDLSSLDLSSLLSQLGLGDVTLGSLCTDLGLSGEGFGTLLEGGGVTALGGLLNRLGRDALNESLTTPLTNAGLLRGSLTPPPS
jgi:hypothetical protein